MLGEALERLLKEAAGGGAVVASSWWLGRALLARRAAGLTRSELEIFSFGLGAAALSQIIFLLGLLQLYYDAVFVALGAGCLAAWLRWGRRPRVESAPAIEEVFWRRTAAVVGIFYGPLYLFNALAPDVGPDSLGYHLGLISRYYREHALVAAAGNIYGLFPQGAEMLYLFAFAFGRHNAPQLVHFAFFAATLALLIGLGRRYGSPGAGWVAALLYGLSPVVAYDAVLAYNDCALAFFSVLTLYAWLWWREAPSSGRAAVVGGVAGFCFALKMTGGLVVVAAGLALLFGSRGKMRPVLAYCAVAGLFVGAWTGRNLVISGSPTAPFYNEMFPSPYATVAWEQGFRDYVSDYRYPSERSGWTDAIDTLQEALFVGQRLGGFVGPVFLFAPLALLAWRSALFRPLAVALAVAAWPWFSNAGARFLIPGLAFLSLLMALGIERLGPRAARWTGLALVVFHAFSAWPAVAERWMPDPRVFRITELPWRVVVGAEPWEAFVQRYNGPFVGARGLAKSAPPGSRALAFSQSADAYFPGEILDTRFSVVGADALRDLQMPVEPDWAPTRVVRLTWDAPRRVGGIRLEQTAASPVEWEIAEIRTVPPIPLEVLPDRFPWTADRLSDGDRLTVWRSWAPLTPGTLDIRLAREAEIRAVEIVMPANQHFPVFALEGSFEVQAETSPAAPGELRAAAHKSLQQKGIEYLLGEPSEAGHSAALRPIERDPAAWGMEEVWREDSWRAYRVLPQGPATMQPTAAAPHPIQ